MLYLVHILPMRVIREFSSRTRHHIKYVSVHRVLVVTETRKVSPDTEYVGIYEGFQRAPFAFRGSIRTTIFKV